MNTTTSYTPLESLLLFQSLAVSGTEPDVFTQISNILKRNALIREAESYDPGRLSSDALRKLYLSLIRDELAYEAQKGEGKGDGSPSRKRKLQSSPITTIKDANQYNEIIPLMVDRLYVIYRDVMTQSIREDERKYALLQREIEEIERGCNERSQKDDHTQLIKATSIAPTTIAEEATLKSASRKSPRTGVRGLQDEQMLDPGQAIISQDIIDSCSEGLPLCAQSSPKESKAEGIKLGGTSNNNVWIDTQVSKQLVPNEVQAPGHQNTPFHDRIVSPPPLQLPQSRPREKWQGEQHHGGSSGPQIPLEYSSNPSHGQLPPPQYPAGLAHGLYSGTPSRGMPLPQTHVSSSPNTNPTFAVSPVVMRRSGPPQGTSHLDQLAEVAELQYRAPTASQPAQQSIVSGAQHGQQYPGYTTQYKGSGTSGNGVLQHWNPQLLPHYIHTLGYSSSAQPPLSQDPFPPRIDNIHPELQQYKSPYIPNQTPRPIMPLSSTPRPLHPLHCTDLPHTPTYGIPKHSTGKATQWKPNPTPGTPKVPQSPKQPEYEPLSPVIPTTKPTKTPKTIGKARKGEAKSENQPHLKSRSRKRGGTAGSPMSSAITGSRRSESVMSHADELSLINENMGQSVKQESSTPRAVDDIGEMTADESVTLRRGGIGPGRPKKRKLEDSHLREPSTPPTHIRWTRNFPKISASALERIGAHRHASIFSQPIKERDAPGYKNIILRPQDLKSIRAAINSGCKYGGTAALKMGDYGQASMMLPISEDLIPPKGLINNTQVEKELMRMFANAIMFNHGPNRGFGKVFELAASIEENGGDDTYELDENSVVNDTRVMFADVEKIVGEMRSAEWRQEKEARGHLDKDDLDELAGGSDMAAGSLAKRRRRI